MKVKSESEVAQSCPTLHNPMDCSLPGSCTHGIFQARVLEWGTNDLTHDYTVEVMNRFKGFKGLDLVECMKNDGWKFITLCKRQ